MIRTVLQGPICVHNMYHYTWNVRTTLHVGWEGVLLGATVVSQVIFNTGVKLPRL